MEILPKNSKKNYIVPKYKSGNGFSITEASKKCSFCNFEFKSRMYFDKTILSNVCMENNATLILKSDK
jgi:hypothetical protein